VPESSGAVPAWVAVARFFVWALIPGMPSLAFVVGVSIVGDPLSLWENNEVLQS
jgi:hypothetical protein